MNKQNLNTLSDGFFYFLSQLWPSTKLLAFSEFPLMGPSFLLNKPIFMLQNTVSRDDSCPYKAVTIPSSPRLCRGGRHDNDAAFGVAPPDSVCMFQTNIQAFQLFFFFCLVCFLELLIVHHQHGIQGHIASGLGELRILSSQVFQLPGAPVVQQLSQDIC